MNDCSGQDGDSAKEPDPVTSRDMETLVIQFIAACSEGVSMYIDLWKRMADW